MWTQPSQGLNFPQIVNLIDSIKVVLHALNGNIFGCLDGLSFKYLRESSFTLFGDKPVLVHFLNV